MNVGGLIPVPREVRLGSLQAHRSAPRPLFRHGTKTVRESESVPPRSLFASLI